MRNARVLATATHWPPARGARALQNERFFSNFPLETQLFVPDETFYLGVRTEVVGSVQIHRMGSRANLAASRLRARLGLPELVVPDRYLPWAFAAARKLRRQPGDVLLSVSKFESSHVAALLVKRARPKLPWVAFFSDPWVDMEYYGYAHFTRLSRPAHIRLEREVIRSATAVIFTNDQTKALFQTRHPRQSAKFEVIPQGFVASAFETKPPSRPPAVIRYLGEFYGPRTPMPFLEVWKQLQLAEPNWNETMRLEFVGTWHQNDKLECVRLANSLSNVSVIPQVSPDEAVQLMAESHVLLLIDAPASSSPFLPSKLIDYIGVNRPILAITSPGAAADLVHQIGGLVAAPDNADAIRQALLRLHRHAQSGSLNALAPKESIRQNFELSRVVQRFVSVIDSCV